LVASIALAGLGACSSEESHSDGTGASAGAGAGTGTGGSTNVPGAGGQASVGGNAGTGAATGAGGAPSGTGGAPPEPVPIPELTELPWVTASCPTDAGTNWLETAEFCVGLDPSSQTVKSLRPKTYVDFDFAPSDRQGARSGPGFFQLGDLTIRYRSGSAGTWANASSAESRPTLEGLPSSTTVLASAQLDPALDVEGLQVTRSWATEKGRLALRFELSNTGGQELEIGALGVPLVFNNIISERTLEEAHERCSFVEPYIGKDAGYVQVTRLKGGGPALLVVPEAATPLEAYGPILNLPTATSLDPQAVFFDPTPRNNTFEGFYEWLVASRAYAESEWSAADPWNPPTSIVLAPGEKRQIGFRFVLADDARQFEPTLHREQRPVAVGVPGYVLPTDLEGMLFLDSIQPVASIAVEPAGALTFTPEADAPGWKAYAVRSSGFGRARVTITYADGLEQTIHYYVTKPAREAVSDMGTFLTTKAWFDEPSDPFGRSPSVMTYDRDTMSVVKQSKLAWVAGLGDDGGATWLAGALKLLGQPDAVQLAKYEEFVDGPVWGNLQYSEGANAYGIKRTLFYYAPNELPAGYYDSSIDWTYWGAWTKSHTLQVPRSYNYPHVTALYWTMYRLARNYVGLVENHPWDWYLDHAYRTAVAMTTIGNDYAQFGLMDGSVFLEVLLDLQREGWDTQASDLEARMRARTDVWAAEAYPFGSEMPWDSTGQEEVYQWTRHFGETQKAKVCLDAVLGYTQTVPHWGYNGCARRYWDFKYGGSKLDRLERMIHHYGSSLNAIPLLTEFRDHPDDIHLLRVGYAGMMGSLTNIAEDGFPSMAFHAFPDTLSWDARTGDYGLNFFGHAYNTATYLVSHPTFGFLAFGGNVSEDAGLVTVTPLDSFRSRLYLAPLGLWLTLDAGEFEALELNPQTGQVRVQLAPATASTPAARLRVEQPANITGVGTYAVAGSFPTERGARVIPLGSRSTWVELGD
jgi:hypothetical protein